MDNQLQKLIELSNKTGDRLIVFDSSNKTDAYVVMGVSDYEKMAIGRSEVRGLTEDELLDKINRDIAIWKSDKIDDSILPKTVKHFEERQDFVDESGVEEDSRFPEDSWGEDWHSIDDIAKRASYKNSDDESKNQTNRAWSIPSERKEKAEEIIEEDRYYLETLED